MAYIQCKIWIDLYGSNLEEHYKAMNAGSPYHTVKALVDTSSNQNFISKNLADKLGIKYGPYGESDMECYIDCLDLSFIYKGIDRLVTGSDEILNDFEVIQDPKADLVLGLQWLFLREAKVDIYNNGMEIYGKFVPFCEPPALAIANS